MAVVTPTVLALVVASDVVIDVEGDEDEGEGSEGEGEGEDGHDESGDQADAA
jgi:hypothetical protein